MTKNPQNLLFCVFDVWFHDTKIKFYQIRKFIESICKHYDETLFALKLSQCQDGHIQNLISRNMKASSVKHKIS